MATVMRKGEPIKKALDKPTIFELIDNVRVHNLGTLTLYEFLAFCTTRRQCKERYINNVLYYLRNGDADTEARFEQYRANHRLRVDTPAFAEVYNYSGDFVDIGRFMSGEPESMVDYMGDQPTKFLTVKIRMASTSGDFFAYFANICDLIDHLESKGTRCRIVAQLNHGNWDSPNVRVQALCDVIVKDYADEFSISTFCAVFFHNEFSTLILEMGVSLTGVPGVIGIDSQFNADYGWPENFVQSPDTSEYIIFPSMWFDSYRTQYGAIPAMPYFTQIGLAHLID